MPALLGVARDGDRHGAVGGHLDPHALAVEQDADLIARGVGRNRQLQFLAIGGELEDGAVLPGGTSQPGLHPRPLDHGGRAAGLPLHLELGLRGALGWPSVAGCAARPVLARSIRPRQSTDRRRLPRAAPARPHRNLVRGKLYLLGLGSRHHQRHHHERVIGGRRLLHGEPIARRQLAAADARLRQRNPHPHRSARIIQQGLGRDGLVADEQLQLARRQSG